MLRVSFIGTGNVATRMADGLRAVGAEIVQMCSPHHGEPIASLRPNDADLIIVAVSDDAIPSVLAAVPSAGKAVWAHTAGSVAMSAFDAAKFPRHGVFYPMQTMSKELAVDWQKVPMFIEGNSPEVTDFLLSVARQLTPNVRELSSENRVKLHSAAVVGCNMVMYLWAVADDILQRAGIDFEVLRPLLEVTLERTKQLSPKSAITGPARRGDVKTIAKHIAALPPEEADTYRFLSQKILNLFTEIKI
jgi:predicted short-subunit dehydrogenase-like oxidoreductase (DUF2520 family)